MSDVWLSYIEAAERLNTTVEGVRLRALRGRWQKTIGNDKRPRIRLPDGWSNDVRMANERRERKTRNDVQTTFERANDAALVHALESHIKTLQGENDVLKEQLADAKARSDKLVADFAARDARAAADLAAERAKTEKAIAAAEARAAQEAAKTEKAIAAFSALAERLDALAAERGRPWWRKLVG